MRSMVKSILGMSKRVKLSLVVVAILAATILLGGCNFGQSTVGVLDVNKVMSDSPRIKQFQDQLNTKGKELSDQLEKDKPNISAEEYQKRQETAYGEFLKTKQELETQIDDSIKQAIEQVGKEKKMGVVLYKTSVAHGGTDVTDDVLKKMQ
ncbi:MAG TPA: OmpH family outer membrane protein [Methylomusa anaerophila]|uniref:Outer membrane protein n=1 Tax=Methylomusa anaerophila TaxID=1930071 RepID=A0A348AKF9_9FIRM|nr:OmpH family outer membrane protein [Methylomusa anaerophila]BBB91557.1 Outer membrane protein [Methylomusa anaerophila]HML89505.1 OmpH family outer membrane protein [Methylomusa anaerophila]